MCDKYDDLVHVEWNHLHACIHTEVNIAKDLLDTKGWCRLVKHLSKMFVHLPHHDRITPFFLPLGTEFIKNMLPIRRESQHVTGKQFI